MSYDYVEGLSTDVKNRYNFKLSVAGLENCPYRLPADVWLADPTQWPDIEFGKLYTYLTSTPGERDGYEELHSPMTMPMPKSTIVC